MNNAPFVIQRLYQAPIQKVWAAITDVQLMRQWYMKELKDFTAAPGFSTRFTVTNFGKDFEHHWTVVEVIPGKKISYEWKYTGYPGNSLVSFELQPEGSGTLLTLTHSGLETFQPAQHPDLRRENFMTGWTSLIGDFLKNFVER